MPWITPFDWITSGMVTDAVWPLASVTRTVARSTRKVSGSPSTVATDQLAAAGGDLALDLVCGRPTGDHVVGQNAGQLRPVLRLEQRLDGAGR